MDASVEYSRDVHARTIFLAIEYDTGSQQMLAESDCAQT